MLPSLKSSYEAQFQKKLEEYRDPEILREVVDQRMIDEMDRALGKLTKILRSPGLESLHLFQTGLQKAHDELSDVLSYGPVRSWAHALLPKGFTALGRVAAFTTGLDRLFRQLPKIVNIVKGSMGADRAWDDNAPMENLLDDKANQKLLKIIMKAMEPNSSLSSLSTGLPYVKDKEAAAEILGLTYNQLVEFSSAAQQAGPPASQAQAKELSQNIQNVTGQKQPEKPVEQPPQATPGEPEKQRLVIPTQSGQATSITSPKPTPSTPTVAEMELDLSDVYDETLLNMLGEKGLASRSFQEFKTKYIRNMLQSMKKKNRVRLISKPQV